MPLYDTLPMLREVVDSSTSTTTRRAAIAPTSSTTANVASLPPGDVPTSTPTMELNELLSDLDSVQRALADDLVGVAGTTAVSVADAAAGAGRIAATSAAAVGVAAAANDDDDDDNDDANGRRDVESAANVAEMFGELQINDAFIKSKKLQTMLDLIDDEDEIIASAGSAAE